MIFKNSFGEYFNRTRHGCYPVNDGDPQNDVEDFDPENVPEREDDECTESE